MENSRKSRTDGMFFFFFNNFYLSFFYLPGRLFPPSYLTRSVPGTVSDRTLKIVVVVLPTYRTLTGTDIDHLKPRSGNDDPVYGPL